VDRRLRDRRRLRQRGGAARGHPSPSDEVEQERIEAEFRQAALDAAVAVRAWADPRADQARAQEMWERMLHSLSHRGISREAYLQIAGRSEQEILTEMEPEAELALRREAVLTAVVVAEDVSPSEEELLKAVSPAAEREGVEPRSCWRICGRTAVSRSCARISRPARRLS